ncbi:MAG: hemerythrin-like [Rhodospirillaceae bacterium]|nr:MAG: hemerythrin-like [Rhodospirillaceae bacterium]TNC98095.1 MAG: hemerythrin-like protein [Stygiobacter sp.]
MAVLTWSETYSVGSAMIDSDHRILINLINQLQDAIETGQSRDVVGSVINVLVEYVEHHFHREEALMTEIGYPEREQHIQSHRDLENRVREARQRWMAGERQVLDDDLMVFLKRWLTDHILRADIAYRPWVEAAAGAHGDAD